MDDFATFVPGKVVCGRWIVRNKLGNGGCGAVFKVEDRRRKNFFAALKVEPIKDDDAGVLKHEAAVLRRMAKCDHVVRLLESGKRKHYNFMVLSLCGFDLLTLKNKSKDGQISDSTALRIGIQTLYAIKLMHELGYVHRDVKPGNVVNGLAGRDKKMFFLIDFGMARSYVDRKNKSCLRPQRQSVLLRGTLRYCSMNVHKRVDQGRGDDLWALLYTLTELFCGVPWKGTRDEREIRRMKETLGDAEIFGDCPKSFTAVAVYLRTVRYEDTPDYFKIYKMWMDELRENQYSFFDQYEWEPDEEDELQTAWEYSEREKKDKKPLDQYELECMVFPNIRPNNFIDRIIPM